MVRFIFFLAHEKLTCFLQYGLQIELCRKIFRVSGHDRARYRQLSLLLCINDGRWGALAR